MPVSIIDRGLIDYQLAWDEQRQIQQQLIAGSEREVIYFCEHSPVLTYGHATELAEVLKKDQKSLESTGIQLIKTDRGGNITYHGPGQLVCYLMLDLRKRRQDVSWYLRSLETSIVKVLGTLGIRACTIEDKTGVWVSPTDKICSIGVRFSRWCSMHGFALNVTRQSELGFEPIVLCGIDGAKPTSIEKELGQSPDVGFVKKQLRMALQKELFEPFGLH